MSHVPRKKVNRDELVKKATDAFVHDVHLAYGEWVSSTKEFPESAEIELSNALNKVAAGNCGAVAMAISDKAVLTLKPKLEKAAKEYIDGFTKADLFRLIEDLIKPQLESIVLQIIGLENDCFHGGRWKVDHCNGRTSELSKLITETTSSLLSGVIEEEVTKWFESPDKNKWIAELRKGVEKEVKEKVREGSWGRIRDIANGITNSLFEEAISNASKDLNVRNSRSTK